MRCMVLRGSRGRPFNAPAAFIHPCQPIVAKQHPTGHGWAHELKHDGYRLQIYVRGGRVRLYTINRALKESRCALPFWSVENLDQSQDPNGACRCARYRRNVLRKGQTMDRPALTATTRGALGCAPQLSLLDARKRSDTLI
jgi:hypothetical protein